MIAGFRVAVGSSGPAENVQLAIERLGVGRLLSATVTGNDVKRGKPDPQVFLTAAARMQVPPVRCVVVEDAPVGVEAAHRGGMRAVAIASTGRTVEQLRGRAGGEVAERTVAAAIRRTAAGKRRRIQRSEDVNRAEEREPAG